MTELVAVDLSHHNAAPDFVALKQAGVIGVILKATEGATYVDPTFADRADQALAAGLGLAAYHFLRPGDMAGQMDHFMEVAGSVARLALDHEDAGVSIADLEAATRILAEESRSELTIYSGHLLKEQLGDTNNGLLGELTSLWIAHYTSAAAPTWPQGTWPVWSLWQYTDKASVDGYGPVDGNRFNGSRAQCERWFGVAPPLADYDVVVELTVAEGTLVKVVINGVVLA